MKIKIFFIVINLLLVYTCQGQEKRTNKLPVMYGGFGGGLDYGGLGFKLEFLPSKSIGLFAAAGYNFNKLGTNGGISWKAFADKKTTPVIMAMYGYNAVINVLAPVGTGTFSETYYGFSAGLGYEFIVGQNRNKISLAVILPIRSSAFKNQYNDFKEAGYTFDPDVLPVLVSIGFNIAGYGRQ